MGQYWLNVAILRVVIPVVFTACAVWRPVGLSLVYLVLMLISPMIPIPTHETMKKTTGHYLKACMFLSLITGLTQFTFQIVLLAVPAIYDEFTKNCELLEKLFRHIGLVHIDNATVWEIFYWLLPEIISLPITIIIYCLCKKFTWKNPDPESSTSRGPEMTVPSKKLYDDANTKIINFLGSIGTYIVLASLCCIASLDPSVEGAFYFLIFLGASTWWSCYKEFNKAFAIICRIIMAVVIVHIIVLLTYQNQWPQELIPFNSTWSRYFALDPYYMTNCSDPRNVVFPEEDSEWTNYGYALRLFWLYYVLALQSQYLFTKQPIQPENTARLSGKLMNLDASLSRHVSIRRRTPSQRWQSARRKARKASVAPQIQPDERTPLMRFGSGRTGLLQDSTGSVIVQDAQQDDGIQMQSLSDAPPEEEPGPMEHIIMAVYSIFQLVVNSSYLATNIMMMTWSIMYHSWTTFVFLLWALILWMVPNKRASMMKCSPFIVIYGTLLVLGGYIYSMNLTEIELPTVIHGIKMSEIGFSKTDELSSWHLIVKCCFMTMFWITMRQYMNEKIRNQQTNTLRDMVAPLHLSVSAATAAMQHDSTEIKSQFMKDVGRVVKELLTKFWIVVVAIMLFTSGITGERMTVFRIIYMTLFLIFVISFQISWSGWRRMMYGFWITVIAYSVVMLMLVYTYQFHNFPNYWEDIGIEEDLQKDIGLEKYETKDLFVRLLTPTFFVIITVLQMHYFHEDFLEATNIDRISVDTVSRRGSLGRSSSIAPMVSTLDVLIDDSNEKTRIYTLKQLKEMSKLERIALFRRTFEQLKNFYNYIWLILEIHMQKIIYLSLMLLCINDVCAINLIFVIAVVVVMNFKRSLQIMAINGIAVTIALLMVTKMLYQIKYINHDNWQVNCTSEIPDEDNHPVNHTKTYNIAEWIGMQKAKTGELPYLLRGYIGIVIVTTCRAIIMVRQCFYRHGRGEPLDTPQVMFPTVTRADADKGIIECLKFLFNYGFYKFGLEFCFMGLVALIGTRLDFFSVLYGIWLLILFAQKRRTIAKIWPFFKCFVIIIVPMQYAFVVAPPTWLCINYPQDYMKLRKWMYLPDPDYPPNAEKLICDFFLLLMIVRQSLVFSIEAKSVSSGQEFIAGHNYSVFHDMDKSNFINPVKDYVSHIYCWLDVLKRGATMSFMWITLSIMFLAGTKRTNLFSLGYLIGAFVFLWQGSDFYLRPVKTILKWWNFLIGYNVIVIFSKAILQGVGCVCFEELEGSACWLVQLLGISCLDKFGGSTVVPNNTPICDVSREDIGMVWDGLCFTFLIIQKRLFKSYYFFHIVDETKAMSILSSRGAELLEDLHKKRIEYQENVEKAVLEKLKFKMDKIKADQQRIQGPSYREPATHKVGVAPLAKTTSMSSCVSSGHTPPQGYRTPIDEDDTDEDEKRDGIDDDPLPLTPRAASLLQAPSPNSAILTVSLDGYLEPTRISFGSPPSSELNPRGASPDETFPVFSPPPYDPLPSCERLHSHNRQHRRQSSFAGTTWISDNPTTRQSIVSVTSRSPRSHHTYSLYPSDRPMYRQRQPKTNREAVRSGDYYMFDDFDDEDNDADLLPDPEDQVEEEERRREQKHTGRRMTISELMTTLLKTDIEIATHVAMYGGTQRDALRLRRQSVPLTRKKSSMSYLSARSETETAAATDDGDRTSLVSSEIEEAEKELKADDLTKSPAPSETGERLDDDDDDDDRPRDEKPGVSLLTYFKFLLQLVNSSMVSATRYLNRFSRDYRYIRKVLAKEKKILKATPDFRMGMRLGINQIWQPIPLMKQSSEVDGSTDETTDGDEGPSQQKTDSKRKESSLTVPHIRILAPSLERGLDGSSSSSVPTRTHPTAQTDEDLPELSEVDQPPVIQLLASIWFGILAHSTFMCYFMVFLHQIKNASLLSIPLPLMVFLWGSLTIPRPSKTFWVTMIAYTEAIVIVKCIFQLELISWNHEASPNNPLYPPRIVGVEKKSNYALWDLLLLLMVFFHRFMLKSLGQWTTPYVSRKIIPSKLTLATMRNNGETSQTEPATRFHWQNEDQTHQIPVNNSDQDISTSRNEITLRNDLENSQHPDDNEDEKLVGVIGEETNICNEKFTTAVNATAQKYVEPAKIFFTNILSPDGKEKTNVYAYMFLCDFFNFILIIFGFSSFGTQQGDGGVAAYFQENRVPMPFLLMLLLQFALIVIDRALFLRKSILGKLIFQYFLVLGVHIWMFFILPSITERQFNERLPPQIWYMIKCFYLLLAAYQLRLGYPTRILGNFLCKNYSIINYGLFKVFMFVPFLFELRAVMDWIWTDTSMTVMDWFKMEDIFASIYQIKCMRGVESDFPQPRGIKKPQMSKYMVGGGALLLIIGLIWFPLLLFALGGTVGVSNIPYEVSLRISIGSYEPIYTMSAQDTSIFTYTEKDFKELKNVYGKSRPAVTFLENYGYSDVAVVRLSGSSKKLWSISPPDKERLRDELLSNDTMRVHVEWTVSRKTDAKDSTGITKTPKNIDLPAWKNGTFNPIRKNLADLLSPDPPPNVTNATIPLLNVFPKFLKVTSRTTAVVPQLMRVPTLVQTWKDDDEDSSGDGRNYLYRNITLNLSSINASASMVQQQWWVVHENCDDAIYDELLRSIPLNNCDFISMFLFNDKAFPTSLSFISGFGILGLYTTAVIVVSQIMRRAVSEMAPKIMFDDMPYVDRILRLCLDIYLVRESGELSLEEDLFAKLIFLYRSPETLIRWTRPPEPGTGANRDGNNDDDDDDDDEVDDVDDEGRERLRNT